MSYPQLVRRRYIPDETIPLADDEILLCDDEIIITKWRTLKPRNDFVRGYSCYFLKRGFKLSKYIDINDNCIFFYCDIIEAHFIPENNKYIFNDLLIDILVYNDGIVKILDLDEIGKALDAELINLNQAKSALALADELLGIIYDGRFAELTRFIDNLT